MKRIHVFGCSGNREILEILVSGDISMYGDSATAFTTKAAEEAATALYNRLPGFAWQAFRERVNKLGTEDPYANL